MHLRDRFSERFLFVVVASILASLFTVMPSGAITGGVPDAGGHPNVGALLWRWEGSVYVLGCSGTLLRPSEFLTAGHCVLSASDPAAELAVTFDADLRFTGVVTEWGPLVSPSRVIGVTDLDVHPGLWISAAGTRSRNDVAIVGLDGSASLTYPGIVPVRLPEAGSLGERARGGGLVGESVVNVGYGVQRFGWHNPTVAPAFDGLRNVSRSPVTGLTLVHLMYLMNTNATGDGGVCVLDSGGPQFMTVGGDEVEVALATGIGWAPCTDGAIGASQRLDLPGVLGFLTPSDG